MTKIPLDILIEISENKYRKDYAISEIIAIKRRLEPYFIQDAKNRQGTRSDLGQELTGKFPEGRVRNQIGKYLGISGRTLEKLEDIVEAAEADPDTFGDILEDVDAGKTSISHAHTKIKRREKHKTPLPLPEGEWSVILADPPWPYYLALRGAPDAHYSRMEEEDIFKMEIPAADDAVIFLWATNPKLKVALEVIEAWGFTYKTNLAWVKDRWGNGHYLRGQHELLLIATKGKIPTPVEEVRPSSVLSSPVREHSRKPDEVYDLIEALYPNRQYLELFSRNEREGWEMWGHDTR